MKRKILLIGGGGHCRVILDLLFSIKNYEIAGIVDLKAQLGNKVCGVPVIGTDDNLAKIFKSGIKDCFISVGSIGIPRLRIKLCKLAKKIGFRFPNLISPLAVISPSVILGQGNYVASGTIINSGVKIGDNCIINTAAIIEHDCEIGDFVHLSPGSLLSGGVWVGKNSHIGIGSIITQDVRIGEESLVGAGSVVTKNVHSRVIVYGNPCKEIRKNA